MATTVNTASTSAVVTDVISPAICETGLARRGFVRALSGRPRTRGTHTRALGCEARLGTLGPLFACA
jgi:hypothetical protein